MRSCILRRLFLNLKRPFDRRRSREPACACGSHRVRKNCRQRLNSGGSMARHSIHASRKTETVTLRTVAEHVGLAPCSVSAILNNSPAGRSIPQHTRDRVLRAAHQLNYRPNNSARSLRTKRTYTVALLAISEMLRPHGLPLAPKNTCAAKAIACSLAPTMLHPTGYRTTSPRYGKGGWRASSRCK